MRGGDAHGMDCWSFVDLRLVLTSQLLPHAPRQLIDVAAQRLFFRVLVIEALIAEVEDNPFVIVVQKIEDAGENRAAEGVYPAAA